MAEEQFERTEPATPRRREKFREKGQVAKSREIAGVSLILIVLTYFWFSGDTIFRNVGEFWRANFALATNEELDLEALTPVIQTNVELFIRLLAPFFMIVLVVSFLSNILQTGWLFTVKPLAPDWNRIDPIAKFKQLFLSSKLITETVINILKLSVLSVVVWLIVESKMEDLPGLTLMTPFQISDYILTSIMEIMLLVMLVYSVVAAIDYLYQWFSQEKKMRMTKQEVKDEYKETEGDPHLKGHMRARMREISMNKLIDQVPEADVIITNPTHLAIALRYDSGQENAPRVLAKGKGFWAQRIKEIAREHKIQIVEDKLLARAMYKSVKIGQIIPAEFYRAVAEILAYVFKLQQEKKMGRPRRKARMRA